MAVDGDRMVVCTIPPPEAQPANTQLMTRGLADVHVIDATGFGPGGLTALPSFNEDPGEGARPEWWRVVGTAQGAIHGVMLDDVKIVTAGRPIVCVWDIESLECVRVFDEHAPHSIMCADMDCQSLVSGGHDEQLVVRTFSSA